MSKPTPLLWIEEVRLLADLKPHPNNPRRITDKQFDKLVESIKAVGYFGGIKINQDNVVLGGNQTLEALKLLKFKATQVKVPVRPLTKKEEERVVISSNISAGAWDYDALANNFDQDDLIDWGMNEDLFPPPVEEIEETPPRLDALSEKWIACPHCGKEFDANA